jgi:hypothetical protein
VCHPLQPLRIKIVADLPESERSIVQQRIVEYMARAEQIKAIISPDLAVSGDSSTPAPGSRPGMPRRFGSGGLPLAGAPASVPSEAAKELTAFEQEILAEVLDSSRGVSWDAIAGLDYAKEQLVRCVMCGCACGLRFPVYRSILPCLGSKKL